MYNNNNKFRFKKRLSVLITDEIQALFLTLLQTVNRNSLPIFTVLEKCSVKSILTVLLIHLLSLHGIELFDAHKGTKSLLLQKLCLTTSILPAKSWLVCLAFRSKMRAVYGAEQGEPFLCQSKGGVCRWCL